MRNAGGRVGSRGWRCFWRVDHRRAAARRDAYANGTITDSVVSPYHLPFYRRAGAGRTVPRAIVRARRAGRVGGRRSRLATACSSARFVVAGLADRRDRLATGRGHPPEQPSSCSRRVGCCFSSAACSSPVAPLYGGAEPTWPTRGALAAGPVGPLCSLGARDDRLSAGPGALARGALERRRSARSEIWVMNARWPHQTRLICLEGFDLGNPVWSPDGSQIA